ALGVTLVVLTVGLVHGFLNDQGRRNSAITAEIVYDPPGSSILNISPVLSIKDETLNRIRTIQGVSEVVGLGQLQRGGRGIDGIDYPTYTKVSGMRVVEGREVQNGNEVMVDRVVQRDRKLRVGDDIELLDTKFRVVGIYEPESFGRLKVP